MKVKDAGIAGKDILVYIFKSSTGQYTIVKYKILYKTVYKDILVCQFKKTEFNKFFARIFYARVPLHVILVHLQKYCIKCDFEEISH
jgi:hypothetical protein